MNENIKSGPITKSKDSGKLINVMTVLGILVTVVFTYWAYKQGLFTSREALDEFLKNSGIWGPIIFMFLQIVQTVVPIIPGALTSVAGVAIFGILKGSVYNYIGIVIGSVIDFYLARRYGKELVAKLVSPKTYNKYIGWLDEGNRFDKLFTYAMFFPISPDDFLCLLAGLSNMTFKKFLIIILLSKPVTLLAYTLGMLYAIKLGIKIIM